MFYLEQYEYNYKNAVEAFKEDLKREIQIYQDSKFVKKYLSGKKQSKKECTIFWTRFFRIYSSISNSCYIKSIQKTE